MTVREIVNEYLDEWGYADVEHVVQNWLDDNGYDGLCREDCGCSKSKLFPCPPQVGPGDCVPGHKRTGDDGKLGIFADTDLPVDERDQT